MELHDGTKLWLQEHLDEIKKKIEARAEKIISGDGLSEQMAVAKAAGEFAPGHEFIQPKEPPPIPFWSRISESFSGITLVSAALVVIFGLLGFYDHSAPDSAQRWLDIAKIFAGAVVGSAGASVISGTRKS